MTSETPNIGVWQVWALPCVQFVQCSNLNLEVKSLVSIHFKYSLKVLKIPKDRFRLRSAK